MLRVLLGPQVWRRLLVQNPRQAGLLNHLGLRIMGEDLVWLTPGKPTSHNWSFHQFTVFILNAV